MGPQGAATSRVPEAARAGRAEKSQKITIPASDSAAASASHRAATTSSPEESEVEELVTFGGGAVPVGSMPKAKIPLPTCPSTAEVTWYETVYVPGVKVGRLTVAVVPAASTVTAPTPGITR